MAIAITQNGNSVNIADTPVVEIPTNSAMAQIFGTSFIQIVSNEITEMILYTFLWTNVTIAGVSPTSQLDALNKITALLQYNYT